MNDPDERRSEQSTVWVNCAVSADGRLALAHGARARLSSEEDLARVQRLRTEVDAILVGVGTIVHDDPTLRVHWDRLGLPPGREPTRIVVDASGRTPPSARVLDGTQPTIVATTDRHDRRYPTHVRTVVQRGSSVDLRTLMGRLPELGVRRVLVEGGAGILASIARERLFDRWTVYTAPFLIGGTTAPPMIGGDETTTLDAAVPFRLESVQRLGPGFLVSYVPGP